MRAAGGSNIGLVATSDGNIGVVGTSNSYIGVAGNSTSSLGVRGISTNGSGVLGISGSSSGVAGQSTSGYGVYGASTSSYAGWFDGPLYASSASASIKSFRIDHPLDPANQVLMHSCVESNERKLVYDGVVTTDAKGEASIELPAWFGALNADLRYQLTPIGDARAWISATVKSNRFSLKTDQPQTEVCWQVTGIRQDAYSKAHPLVVEAAKTGKEKGKYFNPIEHGQPASAGVDYEMQLKAKAVHP